MQPNASREPLRNYYFSSNEGSRKPDTALSYKCIQSICRAYKKVYLVIDALDECSGIADLIETLQRLSGPENCNFFTLCASRRERDIENFSTSINSLQIVFQEEETNQDIAKYVRAVMTADSYFMRWPETIQTEIESALTKGANGM